MPETHATSLIINRLTGPATAPTIGTMLIPSLGITLATLEPARETPVNVGHPAIPAGSFLAKPTQSPGIGYTCPELVEVPGRTKIRIHIGNYPRDTEGCILVGLQVAPDNLSITSSKVAFKKLMDWWPKGSPIVTIVVNDP